MVLLLCVLIKALEQIGSVVGPEQASNLSYGLLWKLGGEQTPVSVLDFQEARQVICLMLHESNEAPIQLLVSLNLILKLTLLVSI